MEICNFGCPVLDFFLEVLLCEENHYLTTLATEVYLATQVAQEIFKLNK